MHKSLRRLFWIAEGLLWLTFMGMDVWSCGSTTWLKFAAIVLCAAAACLTREKLIAAALSLSALADVFLLVLDSHYAVGIGIFLAVQMLHALRLCRMREAKIFPALAARIIVGAAAALCARSLGGQAMLAAGYIAVFGLNVIEAGILAYQVRTRAAARCALGLALFFCCDLCVGITNLTGSALAALGMWAFYLPGQVLIVSSAQGEIE